MRKLFSAFIPSCTVGAVCHRKGARGAVGVRDTSTQDLEPPGFEPSTMRIPAHPLCKRIHTNSNPVGLNKHEANISYMEKGDKQLHYWNTNTSDTRSSAQFSRRPVWLDLSSLVPCFQRNGRYTFCNRKNEIFLVIVSYFIYIWHFGLIYRISV